MCYVYLLVTRKCGNEIFYCEDVMTEGPSVCT